MNDIVPIQQFIFEIRGQRVIDYQDVVTNCDRFASLKHSTVMPHAFKTTSKKFLQTKTTSTKKTAHSLNS